MKKSTYFIRAAAVILVLSLIVCVSFRLFRVHKKYKFFKGLESVASRELKGSGAEYSLFIEELSFFGMRLVFEEKKRFPAASLIKLPILAVALRAVNEQKLSLEEIVTIGKKDIAGGSGKLKAFSLPRKLTFGQLLDLMISSSDNTATNIVIDSLGLEYINNTFKSFGLSDTILVRKMMDFSLRKKGIENYTSASDIACILEMIYKKKLINKKLSGLALSFLKKQKVRDRLPRYLPEEASVAHKTGLERGVVHDAGIVFSPGGDYLICVLVKGSRKNAWAKKFIAQSSLLAYNLINTF